MASSPRKAPASAKRWRRGEYNYWVVVSGVNGCGKTTRARERCLAAAGQGVRVFVHDPNHQFEGFAASFTSPEAWRTSARAAYEQGKRFPLIARFEAADADDVLNLAVAAAAATDYAVPSLFVADEGAMLAGADRYRLTPAMGNVIARRRHLMVGAIIVVQYPRLVHYSMLAICTEMDLMCCTDRRSFAALEDAGVPSATVALLPRLRRGEYTTHRNGMTE